MGDMKWLTILTLSALFSILAQAEVLGVKTVYLLPMAGGLDQYLALQLTSQGVLQVVTDPKKADAVLTDAIGARLEESFTQLYGAPVDKDKSDKDKAGASDPARPNMRPLSSSRGLVFLVNRNTRDVLWSTFERPKNAEPNELKHVAAKIVERLAKAGKAQ